MNSFTPYCCCIKIEEKLLKGKLCSGITLIKRVLPENFFRGLFSLAAVHSVTGALSLPENEWRKVSFHELSYYLTKNIF
jgi:hypothetical protein